MPLRMSSRCLFPPRRTAPVNLPYLAFDYSGRLISELDGAGNYHDAYIPLAKGSVSYGLNPATKLPQLTTVNPSDIRKCRPATAPTFPTTSSTWTR